ncbi:DUF2726 domain-containing protein [Pelagovum pacificum]|uniref:DUF2726 domain-containing protein n=1 Tax=Pelagovum pacificum TaxID=2588711 RepID=A0A5C5GBL6_9RHOB|nr:DUF2726 domain-containing protein [Pelagovum pacificum]QQA41251.1 DUF2726 domain-containing protein [Pelagovum pacificum]TNY31940.1 DUF2726 domain-containing protein [Pelagovum pacificum]
MYFETAPVMPNGVEALFASPLTHPITLLAIFAGLVAVFLLVFRRPKHSLSRSNVRRSDRRPSLHVVDRKPSTMSTRARYMEAVERAEYVTSPIMNKSEFRLFRSLSEVVSGFGNGHRLFSQVSLSEVIRPKGTDRDAFNAINTRSLDFAVVDGRGHLVIAIEYQGEGHYQNGAFARDAIKREVVRKAGAGWLEIEAGESPGRAAELLRAKLSPEGPLPQPSHLQGTRRSV